MVMVIGEDPPVVHEPKAGSFGVAAIVIYGLGVVVAVFVAAYFWFDGDLPVAAAFGVGALAIPVTAGIFVAESVNQRAGALAFVLTAAVIIGAAAASAWYERPDYLERQERGGIPILGPEPASTQTGG